jgi:hypothetical protein
MKLMTKEIENELRKNPIYSHDGEGMNAKVIVKFFSPRANFTWLVTEGEQQEDGDWLFFGYHYVVVWEWGYVRLSDLLNLNDRFGDCFVEREMYTKNKNVRELVA